MVLCSCILKAKEVVRATLEKVSSSNPGTNTLADPKKGLLIKQDNMCVSTIAASTGRCPDVHRRFDAAFAHFASAALLAQQMPLLEPKCFKAVVKN